MLILIIAIVSIIIISIICISQPMITGGIPLNPGNYFNESGIIGPNIDPAFVYNKPNIEGSIDDIGSVAGGSDIDVSPYSEMLDNLNKKVRVKKE